MSVAVDDDVVEMVPHSLPHGGHTVPVLQHHTHQQLQEEDAAVLVVVSVHRRLVLCAVADGD